jgi:hypothetical protein
MHKWKVKLHEELSYGAGFAHLSDEELLSLLDTKDILSANHDTRIALDFPHYCSSATKGCGGDNGWCYTFGGHQASKAHSRKVALIDVCAKRLPNALAEKISNELFVYLEKGLIQYPNLRFSGSGELAKHHLDLIEILISKKINLWGFSKNLKLASSLRALGSQVLISIDKTTDARFVEKAIRLGFLIAYTSIGVDDYPPANTLVTFPLHRGGKVKEVVDVSSLCPKVVEEYFHGKRNSGYCQDICNRCHYGN